VTYLASVCVSNLLEPTTSDEVNCGTCQTNVLIHRKQQSYPFHPYTSYQVGC